MDCALLIGVDTESEQLSRHCIAVRSVGLERHTGAAREGTDSRRAAAVHQTHTHAGEDTKRSVRVRS